MNGVIIVQLVGMFLSALLSLVNLEGIGLLVNAVRFPNKNAVSKVSSHVILQFRLYKPAHVRALSSEQVRYPADWKPVAC
jgi:hypothetical protein